MTDQITVPRATWDAMREAVERLQKRLVTKCQEQLVTFSFVDVDILNAAVEALTAANAVQPQAQGEPVEAIRLSDTVEGSHPSFGGGVFATLDAVDIFYAAPKALAPLTADDVGWVVNDLAELGVKIGDQFFFLYKGNSLVYEEPKHGDGTPMKWRPVGKREFGECCYPIKFYRPNTPMRDRYTDELMFIDGLSFGAKGDEEWRELPLAHGIGGTP